MPDVLETILDELGGGNFEDRLGAAEALILDYSVRLTEYRRSRRRGVEIELDFPSRRLIEILTTFSDDPATGRWHAERIVNRIGQLVDKSLRSSKVD